MIAIPRVKPPRYLVAVAVILVYPLVALYPYDWSAPRRVANTAAAVPGGGLRFAAPGPGIARTPTAPDWVVEAMRTHRLEVEVQARPAVLDQSGPSRLFTLESDPSERNFTIGQDRGQLVVRVRRPGSREPSPSSACPASSRRRCGSMFVSSSSRECSRSTWMDDGGWTHCCRKTRSRTGTRPTASPWVMRRHTTGPGSEISLGQWSGPGTWKIEYARSSALQMPEFLWFIHQQPNLTLFGDLHFMDAAINLLGFIPIGVLLGVWARARRWHGAWIAVCSVALVSGTLELLQFGIPARYPSVNDLVFNAAGGAVGILLGWRLAVPPPCDACNLTKLDILSGAGWRFPAEPAGNVSAGFYAAGLYKVRRTRFAGRMAIRDQVPRPRSGGIVEAHEGTPAPMEQRSTAVQQDRALICGPLLVDAHVHMHDAFERDRFFDGALANFGAAAAEFGLRPSWPAC